MDTEAAEARSRSVISSDDVSSALSAPASFALLYEECRLPVYRFLRSRCRSDDEAADLTATTFERALRSFASYDPRHAPLPWLLRIARNAAIDAARRLRPVANLEEVSDPAAPAEMDSPEERYLHAERDAELRRLVFTLPDLARDAVALRYGAELSTREIAVVIGKTEAATQKVLQRALATLREAHHATD